MKNLFTVFLFCFLIGDIKAGEDKFLAALASYKKASREHVVPEVFLGVSSDLLNEWHQLDDTNKTRWADKLALVHFLRAELFAQNAQYEMASSELREELKTQANFGGKIEYSTKLPEAFFKDLVELQAQVTTETGIDPMAGQVGYYFEKDGNGFTAARLQLDDEVAGITVPEKGDNDALALVYRLNRQGNKFVATTPKWFVVPKGELRDVLKQAKREVTFDATGKMVIHALRVGSGKESTTTNFESVTDTSELPPVVQPPTPPKAHDEKPPILGEKPTSSTPWSIIVVLVVVAIGLLRLLLKKRK